MRKLPGGRHAELAPSGRGGRRESGSSRAVLWIAVGAAVAAVPARAAAQPASDAGPAARAHHVLVRHVAEDRTYLIGGSTPTEDGHRYFDDIWSWDGEAWSPAGTLPFPRSSHRVVYDPVRETLLLFGGTDGDGVRADGTLRERREGSWAVVARSEEAAAGEPGACWDRERERLVLHGGARPDRSYGSTTWEWDGGRLVKVAARGPGPRLGHVLVWDPAGRKCILFGGRDPEGTVHGDTWVWNGSGWRQLDVDGPPARWIHTASTDPVGRRAVIFGGQDPAGNLLGDTWSWDGERWELLANAGPEPRMMGRMAPTGDAVLLFGGRGRDDSGYRDLADTWMLGGDGWRGVIP